MLASFFGTKNQIKTVETQTQNGNIIFWYQKSTVETQTVSSFLGIKRELPTAKTEAKLSTKWQLWQHLQVPQVKCRDSD